MSVGHTALSAALWNGLCEMPRPSLGSREVSRVSSPPPRSEQSSTSKASLQGPPVSIPEPRAAGCWHRPRAGQALGCGCGHNQSVSSWPRHAGTSPQGQGPEENPLRPVSFALPSSPLSATPLPGERQRLPSEFPQLPCLPTHQRPSTLGTWHRPPPILPGAAAARGACPPSRLHSGTRHWLDTNVNPTGRANSGHPQRRLRAQAGPCWEIFSGCH